MTSPSFGPAHETVNEVAEVLIQARELIADPGRWTQGAYARTADGREVDARSDAARRWCVLGAVAHVVPDVVANTVFGCDRYAEPLDRVAESFGFSCANQANDKLAYQGVLRMLDTAIAEANGGSDGD